MKGKSLQNLLLLFCCVSAVVLFTSTVQANTIDAVHTEKMAATITGTVIDGSGEPLIGVSILVKGTSNGTVTDLDGNFSVEASEGDILVFSYTGFSPQEIAVGSEYVINVTLQEDVAQLSEVVVTGYSTQKKANLTGAVGVIGAEELSARPITSASQALQGQVSGVWINQNSGEPGQDGATIRIRGIGTLNDPDPLIIN